MTPVLRTKAGCRFDRIAPGGFRILAALDRACHVLGRDLTITSGTDSHVTGRHPNGEAFDVSCKGLDVADVVKLYDMLTSKLGESFTVLYETKVKPIEPGLQRIAFINPKATGAHFHIQTRLGTTYPPDDAEDGVVEV